MLRQTAVLPVFPERYWKLQPFSAGKSLRATSSAGGGEGVVACGYCHLPNGQGKPENAGLAGQPFQYIVQQMEDYRNGLRKTGEPRMGPPAFNDAHRRRGHR